MAKSYYAILGITATASQSDVKAAYRRLAKEFHPDRYAGADRPFLKVQEAYSVLSDSSRRREYDAELSRVRPSASARSRPGPGPEPLTRQGWSDPAPEPLVPRDAPADMGKVSPIRSFRTVTPSFNDIFDWLWDTVLFRPSAE
ncbi:MAG: J domain-containing protein [Sedimentisphaerales bacterium]|nr:J domain-containing protein [Sedimentisphaerales bacterium]